MKTAEKVLFSLAEGNKGLQHLSEPLTFDPMDCTEKHMLIDQDDHPVKATIEKALGDEKYFVRLGDVRDEVLTYNQINKAMNKAFEDGQQY